LVFNASIVPEAMNTAGNEAVPVVFFSSIVGACVKPCNKTLKAYPQNLKNVPAVLGAAGIQFAPIRHDPDEAGLLGAVHLARAWIFKAHDAILAVDIGGTNIRVGITSTSNEGMAPASATRCSPTGDAKNEEAI